MINRNDLTKQFELVVKQEIKNHNDAIYDSNQALQNVKKDILSISNYIEVLKKNHVADISSHEQYINSLRDSFVELKALFNSSVRDQDSANKILESIIKEFSDMFDDTFLEIEKISKRHEELELQNVSIAKALTNVTRDVNESLRIFRENILSDLTKTKNEILFKPLETEGLRSYLEDKIKSNAIDVEGIMREINFFKRENFIVEKKLENIYTLIDRLKGAKT